MRTRFFAVSISEKRSHVWAEQLSVQQSEPGRFACSGWGSAEPSVLGHASQYNPTCAFLIGSWRVWLNLCSKPGKAGLFDLRPCFRSSQSAERPKAGDLLTSVRHRSEREQELPNMKLFCYYRALRYRSIVPNEFLRAPFSSSVLFPMQCTLYTTNPNKYGRQILIAKFTRSFRFVPCNYDADCGRV